MSWNENHGVGYVIKMTMRGELWPKIFFIPRRKYREIDTEAGEVEVFSSKGMLGPKTDGWW